MPAAALLLVLFCAPAPVEGPVAAGFAPQGRWAGHWGVDWAVPIGTEVRAVAGGTVTFAGRVAGTRSVTVHHGGGVRTSYSYLERPLVRPGQRVEVGQVVGISGLAHGSPGLHLSLRAGDRYLDPLLLFGCRLAPPGAALRLGSAW